MKLAALLFIILALPGAATRGVTLTDHTHGFGLLRSARTQVRAASNTFDLTSFGAVGDGLADDGPALQSALDAIADAGGGTLFVPAGRYAIYTPVHKNFAGLADAVTIRGVESSTTVAPPGSSGQELTRGLDLVSEFFPRTGETQNAVTISGLDTLLIEHILFIGTEGVQNDALVTLALHNIAKATIRHSEFYGLSSLVAGAAIIQAYQSDLTFEQSVVLGSACSSGVYSSIIQNIGWKGITISEAIFADYGQRELYGKMNTAPFSWISIDDAAPVDNESPRREAVIRSVFLDEGGYMGITSLPYRGDGAPIDLIYITGLHMNVSNFGTSGHYLYGTQNVLIEKSHYGYSHNASAAIQLLSVGNAIIDEATCIADADRISADSGTGRLTVINSTYSGLDSEAQSTEVITTATPEEDPVQHVRQQFVAILGRVPDAAAHLYWSDQILRCGADTVCADGKRAALAAYLGAAPSPNFTISGRVTDENGAHLAGTSITLSGSQSVTTTTDSTGQYHFSNLPTSGSYTLTAAQTHYTFSPPDQIVTTPSGDRTVDFAPTLNRYSISGDVSDVDGNPVAGASIELSGTQSGTTTTEANGAFSFAGLPALGTYTLAASTANYSFSVPSQTLHNLSSDQTTNFVASLMLHSISGRATAADGTPIAGATISVSGSRTASTTTDSNGAYVLQNLPGGGDFVVQAAKPSYSWTPSNRVINDLGSNQTADFVASLATRTVSGRVTENGQGLSGVAIQISGPQTSTTTTGADGNYSLSLPLELNYIVTASKQHYTFTPGTFTFNNLVANQTGHFTAIRNRHAISGRVVNVNNSGLPGTTVSLSGAQTATTTTNSAGDYAFTNLPAGGDYTVQPSLQFHSFTPANRTFTNLAASENQSFVTTLSTHTISGRVSATNGSPLAGAAMALSGAQGPITSTTTGADGTYSFASLPAGSTYIVSVSKSNRSFTPDSQSFTALNANQTANFTGALVNYSVGGRVVENGTGVSGVAVALSGSQTGLATTDANGSYSFNVPAEGNYTLTPSKQHYTFNAGSLSFNNLSATQTGNFTATRNRHAISGRVVNVNNSGLPGTAVSLSGAQTAATITNSAGDYAFTNLPAGGDYTVQPSLQFHSFTPANRTFTNLAASENQSFVATLSTHTISGRVSATNGSPLAGAAMALSGSQGPITSTTTGADGTYSFASLQAGSTYVVSVSKSNRSFTPDSQSFTALNANQTASFTGALVNYSVGGRVVENGTGVSGVAVALSGSQTGLATTDANGSYSFNVPAEGNYTLTPSKQHYTFNAGSLSFNNLSATQTGNFTAIRNRHAISGRVVNVNNSGVPGTTVSLSGAQTATATTNSAGDYAFTNLPAGGDYTVQPSLQFHSFTPTSRSFTDLSANQETIFVGALNTHTISGQVTNSDGTPLAGATVALSGSAGPISTVTTTADGNFSFSSLPAGANYVVTVSKVDHVFNPASRSFSALSSNQSGNFSSPTTRIIGFESASLSASEGTAGTTITVTRWGDASAAATVIYAATNGTAIQGRDVGTLIGQLSFAPGESSRTFPIFVIDDAFVEGVEQLTVSLSDPQGAALGSRASATLTINDNDTIVGTLNPIDDARFFVRQHYRDFLNREPDAAGLDFWSNQILACGVNAACLEDRRVNVSAAFFFSVEFQETGFLVHRVYRASFAQPPQFRNQFLLDTRTISQGVVVDAPGWQQLLENNKIDFLKKFVERSEFKTIYPLTLTPTEFVNLLNGKAGNPLAAEARTAAIAEFNGSATSADTTARARVLRLTAESATFTQREISPAFVLMQYFGYLQRNPSDPPDSSLEGYNFWLSKLNEFGGDFHRAQMVKSFLEAGEYRTRFGP